MNRIGILTGGGDVPGLNAGIKTLVRRLDAMGLQAVGIRRGWEGLLFFNPSDPDTEREYIRTLNPEIVRTVDRTGGTFLHTSRVNPGNVKRSGAPGFLQSEYDGQEDARLDFTHVVLANLEHLQIDGLVVIGGDDTLGYASKLHHQGFPILGIPKTMDNDVFGTDYCIGFSTAITRTVDAIQKLRSTIGSHERFGIIELFGRYSGETALFSAYLADADRAILAEVPFSIQHLADLLTSDMRSNPSRYAIMTISESAREIEGEMVQTERTIEDPYGHKRLGGVGSLVAEKLESLTGHRTAYYQVSYMMRSGEPDILDLMVAKNFARNAIVLLEKGEFGRMMSIQEGCYTHVPLELVENSPRHADLDLLYDSENYVPRIDQALGMPMFLQ
ncbi:MAG: 6-phosphofructokinase [Anaerolineales bacterium]|jgi:6-phosphofructokinase 1